MEVSPLRVCNQAFAQEEAGEPPALASEEGSATGPPAGESSRVWNDRRK